MVNSPFTSPSAAGVEVASRVSDAVSSSVIVTSASSVAFGMLNKFLFNPPPGCGFEIVRIAVSSPSTKSSSVTTRSILVEVLPAGIMALDAILT